MGDWGYGGVVARVDVREFFDAAEGGEASVAPEEVWDAGDGCDTEVVSFWQSIGCRE